MNNVNMNLYMTNTTESDLGQDEELYIKNTKLSQELTAIQQAMHEKEKELAETNRKIEDIQIELEHQKELNKNQENLIEFYKKQETANKGEEEIKALKEKLAAIEEEKKEMTKEMDDLKEVNENMLNMLTTKELENEQLLKQVESYKKNKKNDSNEEKDTSENNENKSQEDDDNQSVHEHFNTEETEMMKEVYKDLQDEYDNYKKESEEKIKSLTEQLDDIESLKAHIDELENTNSKLKEELNYQIEQGANSNNDEQDNSQNKVLLNEIEHLQSVIRSLQDSKEQLLMNSKEEKSYIVSERKEIENMYNTVNEQKIALEIQLNDIKSNINKEISAKEAQFKQELSNKEKEISLLKSTIDKVNKEKDDLISKKDKLDSLSQKYCQMVTDTKNKYENEKSILERKVKELQMKNDIEKKTLDDKVKELTIKIEEMTNELNTKNKENTTLRRQSKLGLSLGTLLQDGNDQNEIDDLNNTTTKLKGEINEMQRYKAENEFLSNNIISLNKQIEAIKSQREKDKVFYMNEVKVANDEAVNAKCELAAITYEKDNEILKLKKYVKRFQEKLTKLGFQILTKRK